MILTESVHVIDPKKTHAEIWICMRSTKSLEPYWFTSDNVRFVPELAPSWDLFVWYRRMSAVGQWNEKAFQEQYAPRFISELRANQKAKDKLNQLYLNGHDKNIILCCSCWNQNTCHRLILASLLYNVKADVVHPHPQKFIWKW